CSAARRVGIDLADAQAIAHLRDEQSREITTRDELARVASISANDEEVGRVIADAIDRGGNEGALSGEDANTTVIELELTDGMRVERGWLSQDLVTDEARTE